MSDPRYRLKAWRTLRAQVIRRDGGRCAMADDTCSDMTRRHAVNVDHIIEVKDGGPFWDANNLQVLCSVHHRRKTSGVKTTRGNPVSPNA